MNKIFSHNTDASMDITKARGFFYLRNILLTNETGSPHYAYIKKMHFGSRIARKRDKYNKKAKLTF